MRSASPRRAVANILLFPALAIAASLAVCVAAAEEDALAHAQRAAKLHSEGKFSEALQATREAARAGMRNHNLFILMGDCLMREADFKQAHLAFDAALGHDAKSAIALRGRATAALKARFGDSAIDATTRLIELGENEYLRRGKAFAMQGRQIDAIEDFQTLLMGLEPGSPVLLEAYFERGESLQKLGTYDLALADFDRALALAREDLPAIHQLRGEALSEMQRSAEAVAAFTRSLTLFENEDILLLRGREWGYLAEYDKAIADFERAAEIAPQDAETQKNAKGNIAYMEQQKATGKQPAKPAVVEADAHREEMGSLAFDKPATAIARINAVLEKDPGSISALRALSRYHQHLRNPEAAFAAIAKASKLDRDNPEVLKEFAAAAILIKQYHYAIQGYTRAIVKGDRSAHAPRADLLVSLGLAGVALGDLSVALKLDPANARIHFLNSVSLLAQPGGSGKQAAAAFARALELGYDGKRLYRAQALENLGRYKEAIADYSYDIENGSAFAGMYLRRGSCYEQLKRPDLALADFQTAARLSEEGSNTKKAALGGIESVGGTPGK